MTLTAKTRLAVVLGDPVAHSKSPELHNAALRACGVDAVYLALRVSAAELPAAIATLRAAGALGASVTVPHKQEVIACCHRLSPAARDIGAVNTLEFGADGQITGHNTDAPGYVRAYEDAVGASLQGARVVLLGGGGAARAVARGVREAGAASIEVIARRPAKVEWIAARPWDAAMLTSSLKRCDLLVDCTSMGLDASGEASVPCAIPLENLSENAVVSTLVYHRQTALIRAAGERGLRTLDGAGMLLFQGAIAFALWTGLEAPVEAMRAAMRN